MTEEAVALIGIQKLALLISLPENVLADLIKSGPVPHIEANEKVKVGLITFLDWLTEKFWHHNDAYWPTEKRWSQPVGEDSGLKKLVNFQTLSECTMVPEEMLRSFVDDPGMPHYNVNGYFLVDPLEAWEWLDNVFNISVTGRNNINEKPLLIKTRSDVEREGF